MSFQPDYRHFADVMKNIRPARLPLYEHTINQPVYEEFLGVKFGDLFNGDNADKREYFRYFCKFFKDNTYDVVSYEVCISSLLPQNGAIMGGHPGPIQCREDFDAYPWDEVPDIYWKFAAPVFSALRDAMPDGMKAVGGVGNGVYEISEDLVGLEYLPLIQVDDPVLYADIFNKIGDLMSIIWEKFLREYSDIYVTCRFGDDLGFRSSLLTNPATVRENIIPQYARVINQVHAAGKPFLWHSCGCIFEIMEDVIALGIDGKHSNEDAISPFTDWLDKYNDRIAIVGGFDMDFMCRATADEVFEIVVEQGTKYRNMARGYALGTGNSIASYIPMENYLALVRGGQEIRRREGNG